MFAKTINQITNVTKWLALATMAFMMFFITVAVVSRTFFSPIVGDVEIVRLGMVVLIMFGLAYTQKVDGHISIGLLVDRFPIKWQKALDIFAALLTLIVTITIGFIFIGVSEMHRVEMPLTTDLLGIAFYPFDFIIVVGFILWGLEALLRLAKAIIEFSQIGHTREVTKDVS